MEKTQRPDAIATQRPLEWIRLALIFALTFASGSALADPNRVTYSNGIDPAIEVIDDMGGDLDPDPDEIRVEYSLLDNTGDWLATGEIVATTTDPDGATLVVTKTEITNVTGEAIVGEMIFVDHYFDVIVDFDQLYSARIDGAFDKLGGGILGNFELVFDAYLNGAVLIDAIPPIMGGLQLAPLTFNEPMGVPPEIHLDTVNRESIQLTFYIDEIDNFIALYDSATILPVSIGVPGLGVAARLLLSIGIIGAAARLIRRSRPA